MATSPNLGDSVFSEYETDFETLTTSIAGKLAKDAREQRGEARRTLLRRIEMELEEADEIVGQMEIEVQTADREEKPLLQGKLRQYKSALSQHKSDIKTLASTADRDDLLSTSTSTHVTIEMEDRSESPSGVSQAQAQRSQLLSATDKLTDGQRRLEESHRVALETEDLGAGILRDLRDQRDTLEHTRDSLFEADGSIDRASNTLKKMVRRAYQQRAVTYGIIVILVFLM
ncbi:vesicle transport v-snare protein vti1 [Leucosporidium creatinivorum]|uniref:Vesicle transport v-snare protein vti1 n=1 Tax=Leucosporidium creatinivorum TaxID=106004 RepID=A0A1Y2FZ07_9BASI|nr:vesicle transport v-snare protein vti1 [Leucosporidium creatinivorum]